MKEHRAEYDSIEEKELEGVTKLYSNFLKA
jgi:hypothetical protein